jgi:signal transduction histidine kinase
MYPLPPHILQSLRDKWGTNSLSRQFAMAGSAVLLAGMLIMGMWVAEKIETIVSLNMAIDSALYMDSFVAPHVQDLYTKDFLSPIQQQKLDALLNDTSIGSRIDSFKIWKSNGLVVYSSQKSIIGKTFPPTNNLKLALKGNIASEFNSLEDAEDAEERASGVPYLEIYSPIREKFTGRIIAVAEFYVRAELFQKVLFEATLQSWMVVGLVTMVMLGLLFVIVQRGSRTIDDQKMALESRIEELSDLRNRLQSASRKATERNEHFLRHVGSDLHDGPAQLLGLVLLRLDALKEFYQGDDDRPDIHNADFEIVQSSLKDALEEIRNISAGLVLPELDGLSLADVLVKAIKTHEHRTGSKVHRDLGTVPLTANKSACICLYRFVQECLNNAYHHTLSAPCSVSVKCTADTIEVKVADSGDGFDPLSVEEKSVSSGLGLAGLRERIESLGGKFEIHSAAYRGTVLSAKFLLVDLEMEYGE